MMIYMSVGLRRRSTNPVEFGDVKDLREVGIHLHTVRCCKLYLEMRIDARLACSTLISSHMRV